MIEIEDAGALDPRVRALATGRNFGVISTL
ncbi:MAG: hypothetical protein RLZZ353_1349, partial [Actinomycetota bacterium]